MIEFKVTCDHCNNGNLCLPNGYDGLDDFYTVHCTNCDHVFTTHYTGMDNILEAHQYNMQVGEDVKLLNANGSWHYINRYQGDSRFSGKDGFDLNEYSKGMKHIQSIEEYETHHYYQNKGNFIQISHNSVHDVFEVFNYVLRDDADISKLTKHFFGATI